MQNTKPEVYFLKYAFPCSFIIRQRSEITKEQFNKLEDAAINNKALPKEFLEKIYFRAFEKIKSLASELKKDKWDIKVIRKYFLEKHNELITNGMYSYDKAPEALKNLCKIHKARIIKIKSGILIVEYDGNKTRCVMNYLVPDAKINDIVTIHYGYAVEKI